MHGKSIFKYEIGPLFFISFDGNYFMEIILDIVLPFPRKQVRSRCSIR